MKRISIVLMLALMPFVVSAQSHIERIFEAMPDSMITYLDKSQFQDLTDADNIRNDKAFVVNNLGDTTRMVALNGSYLKLRCNKSRDMEMKLLPLASTGDTIVCVVNTYKGPAEESTISFYDKNWHKVPQQIVEPVLPQQLIVKPDSMSDDTFNDLKEYLDPVLIRMSLSPTDNSLTVQLSVPNIPNDKKRQVLSIISQTKFNWNGERYN